MLHPHLYARVILNALPYVVFHYLTCYNELNKKHFIECAQKSNEVGKMQKYVIVKKYIDEMDYCSLLLHGAPDDEFDNESQEISDKITYTQTERDIAQIIAEVFQKSFDRKDSEELFIDCAKKIYADLHYILV